MNVVWSPRALRDLDEVLGYTHQHSPAGASNLSHAIERSIAICARNPQLGSMSNEPSIYRWPFVAYRYTSFYRHIKNDKTIKILCLLRSGRIRNLRHIPDEL
jgi:toxin ParE1/3/4